MKTRTVRQLKINGYVWAVYALVALLSLWIRSGFPIFGMPAAMHDDGLFMHLANQLLMGDWLGDYNNRTLAKGIFYPFFIACSAVAGIPLKIAEHLLYLFCSFLAARYVVRITGRETIGLIMFVLLAFNPVLWTQALARVIREGIYLSLSMLLLILSLIALFPSQGGSKSRNGIVLKALITGIVAGFYWLTREEGIWLAPALTIILVFALIRQKQLVGLRETVTGFLPKTLILIALAFCVVVGLVRYENWRHYKVSETTEFRSAPFLRAYGALARIKHDTPRRYIVFPRDARERAYLVSEAARELKPHLDGQLAENWMVHSRHHIGTECTEISSALFMWAFRDAVALAGHYSSGDRAMDFYNQLTKEINAACEEGKIECLPPRTNLTPVFRKHYIVDALSASRSLFALLLSLGRGQVGVAPSWGAPDQLAAMEDLVGPVNPGKQQKIFVRGWVAAKHAVPRVELLNESDGTVAKVTYLDAADVKRAFPEMVSARFEGSLLCEDRCKIRVIQDGRIEVFLGKGALVNETDIKLFIDGVSSAIGPVKAARTKMQQTAARSIAKIYSIMMPFLCLLGIFGIILGMVRIFRTGKIPVAYVLALASLVAVLTRIALLSYLEVTSIPSLNILYASPASPFVIIFAVTGSVVLLDSLKSMNVYPRSGINRLLSRLKFKQDGHK
jgi:hypothetical protein